MSSKEIFFISGLPRSGSTLLCNILAQNPEIFVSKATSGCVEILFSIRNQWDRIVEHQAEGIDRNQLKNLLKVVLNSYHLTNKNIIAKDTSKTFYHPIDGIVAEQEFIGLPHQCNVDLLKAFDPKEILSYF